MPPSFTLWAEIQKITTNPKKIQQIPKKTTKMTILLTISDFYISTSSLKNPVIYGKMQKKGDEIRSKFQRYHS